MKIGSGQEVPCVFLIQDSEFKISFICLTTGKFMVQQQRKHTEENTVMNARIEKEVIIKTI